MPKVRKALSAVAMAGLCLWWAGSQAADQRPARSAAQARKAVSDDVQFALKWIAARRDNRGKPFAVVDKRRATIHVYDARSRPVGTAAVLLGSESEQVLMETTAPVLVVKHRGERIGLLQVLLDRDFQGQPEPRFG